MHAVYLCGSGFAVARAGNSSGGSAPDSKKRPWTTKIAGLLTLENILFNLEVSSKAELFEKIAQHMERAHGVAREAVALGLSRREQAGSTALGDGVAIPHARIEHLDRVLVAYVCLKSPIPFDAADGQAVSRAFVLLVPAHATEEHFGVVAEATRLLFGRRFRERLARCGRPVQVKRLFDDWPRSHLGQ